MCYNIKRQNMQIELKKTFKIYYFRCKGSFSALKIMIISLMENSWPTCHAALLRFCNFWGVRHWFQAVEGLNKEWTWTVLKSTFACTLSWNWSSGMTPEVVPILSFISKTSCFQILPLTYLIEYKASGKPNKFTVQ